MRMRIVGGRQNAEHFFVARRKRNRLEGLPFNLIVNFGDDLLDVRGNFIDAPLMAPVPEPSTWALMLLGLVGVTGWARRKAQQA